MLRRLPEAIHWYLNETVFPDYLRHQRHKVRVLDFNATGQLIIEWYCTGFCQRPGHWWQHALSTSYRLLRNAQVAEHFARRYPHSHSLYLSDLMPVELGKCDYEKGSDGKMYTVLTDPDVVSFEMIQPDWKVTLLLDNIAKKSKGSLGLCSCLAPPHNLGRLPLQRAD